MGIFERSHRFQIILVDIYVRFGYPIDFLFFGTVNQFGGAEGRCQVGLPYFAPLGGLLLAASQIRSTSLETFR